jgi:hypothetical protein
MLAHALSALAYQPTPLDSDLSPLTSDDVVVVSAPDYPRITVALTRRTALTPGGQLVALMFSHGACDDNRKGGKCEAYVVDGDDMTRVEL